MSSTLALLKRINRANLHGNFGHSDWWKLHALSYMMSHRQPSYRTRDVRPHLAKTGATHRAWGKGGLVGISRQSTTAPDNSVSPDAGKLESEAELAGDDKMGRVGR